MTTLPYAIEEAPEAVTAESSRVAAFEEAEQDKVVVHVSVPYAGWVPELVERMEELVSLSVGWAGDGSRPPRLGVAAHALEVLSAWSHPDLAKPQVVPTFEGGVQLEWHERGIDFEVEIEPSLDVEVRFFDHQTAEEWDGSLSQRLDHVRHAIGRLSG